MERKVAKILDNLGIHVFSYSEEWDQLANLTAEEIEEQDVMTVAKYIYLFSQYATYLTQQRNFIKIRANYLRDKYEKLLAKLVPNQPGKTLKEKKMAAQFSPELSEIEEELKLVESLEASMEDMPEMVIEQLNALKRIMDAKLKVGG